jgi:hypothetical protein
MNFVHLTYLLCALLFLFLFFFIGSAGGNTSAKAVIYGADASKYREEPPEQRTAEDVCQLWLGVWNKIYSPCCEKAAGNDTYVPEYNQAYPPGPIA